MIQKRLKNVNVPRESLSDFADKDYRDGFLEAVTRSGIAYQIKALRHKFGYSQKEMAAKTEKTQSVISRLEGGGRASVQTLIDIASALDVALIIRFVSYPEFLTRANDMSEPALQPDTIHESLASAIREGHRTNQYQILVRSPLTHAQTHSRRTAIPQSANPSALLDHPSQPLAQSWPKLGSAILPSNSRSAFEIL